MSFACEHDLRSSALWAVVVQGGLWTQVCQRGAVATNQFSSGRLQCSRLGLRREQKMWLTVELIQPHYRTLLP